MSRQPLAKRLLTALLGLLVLGATIAPPLLDAEERPGEVRVESEHDPARCAVLHDHAACAQLAKSFARTAKRVQGLARITHSIRGTGLPDTGDAEYRSETPTRSPRAPPDSLI